MKRNSNFFVEYFGTPQGPLTNVVFGGVAGAVAQSTSYPLDIVRRRMQTCRPRADGRYHYSTIADTLRLVYRCERRLHLLFIVPRAAARWSYAIIFVLGVKVADCSAGVKRIPSMWCVFFIIMGVNVRYNGACHTSWVSARKQTQRWRSIILSAFTMKMVNSTLGFCCFPFQVE